MDPFNIKVNKNIIQTKTAKITGREILDLAKLNPPEDFQLLIKINEKGFEPVGLTEEIDLTKPGIEGFKASPYKKLKVLIDDKNYEVEKCFLTPLEILDLAGKSSKTDFLQQILLGGVEIGYRNDLEHKVSINNGSRFQTFPLELEFCIVVNAQNKIWKQTTISYEELIILYYGSISNDPNVIYTINYKNGPKGHESGSLVKGQTVCVTSKMVFNATQTNKS